MEKLVLPTTVVGSWPVPEWLERLKTDYFRSRMSRTQLEEIHDCAVTAAIKEQELAGIDIVSDGELRRDNDVDYLLARIPGIEIPVTRKDFYYDYYEARTSPVAPAACGGLGLDDDFAFTRARTDRPVRFSFTGPFSLSRRVAVAPGGDPAQLVRSIAHVLAGAARALRDAGADLLQIDEPFLAGHPEQVGLAVEAINIVTADVDVSWALHVCYGNRYARPLWEGHYDFLFPAVLDARVDQLVLEFARKGYEDLPVIERSGWDRGIGLGVIDVKSHEVESPELVSARIEQALELVGPERLTINPDCGLRNLPTAVATAKLRAMVDGTARVRAGLAGRTPGDRARGAA
jgi:5-methyltetrahydropteroyltriglutamate--homocysteine methyltransferase